MQWLRGRSTWHVTQKSFSNLKLKERKKITIVFNTIADTGDIQFNINASMRSSLPGFQTTVILHNKGLEPSHLTGSRYSMCLNVFVLTSEMEIHWAGRTWITKACVDTPEVWVWSCDPEMCLVYDKITGWRSSAPPDFTHYASVCINGKLGFKTFLLRNQ